MPIKLRSNFRRHHNLLAAQGVPNITGPINKGKGQSNTAGKGHGKGRLVPQGLYATIGANTPNYGDVIDPAAFYDATENRTWYAMEGWNGTRRAVYVLICDHANSDAWFGPYLVSTATLTNDAHGNPAIIMDDEGYVHIAFGSHVTPTLLVVSRYPRDPTEWNGAGSLGTLGTYPHFALVGSTLHFLQREGDGTTQPYLTHYKTTSLVGGVATWSAGQNVVNFSGGRIYPGKTIVTGNVIEVMCCYADANDTLRRGVYHFRLDTTDDSLKNSTGSVSTAVGSQPISKATADTSYRIFDHGANYGVIPAWGKTSNGNRHVCFVDDTAAPWDVKYISDNGAGVWSSPVTITSFYGSSTPGSAAGGFISVIGLVVRASDNLEFWYSDDPSSLYLRGGIMKRVVYNGAWGGAQTMATPSGTYGLEAVVVPLDHIEKLYVLFSENKGTEADADAGDAEAFAYGSGGFIPLRAPIFVSGPTIVSTGGAYAGAGDVLSINMESNGTSHTYAWKKAGVANGSTGSTYTVISGDHGSNMTGTVTATNGAGSTPATTPAVAAAVPGYTAANRTLSDTSNRTLSDTTTRTIYNRTA